MNRSSLVYLGLLAAGCAEAPPARIATAAEPTGTAAAPEPTPDSPKSRIDEGYTTMMLNRASAFSKTQCGAATNDAGQLKGPWGKASVTLKVGRNGRPFDVVIGAPHAGTPTGNCVVHNFEALIFLPYPGDHDETREVEVVINPPAPLAPAAE